MFNLQQHFALHYGYDGNMYLRRDNSGSLLSVSGREQKANPKVLGGLFVYLFPWLSVMK